MLVCGIHHLNKVRYRYLLEYYAAGDIEDWAFLHFRTNDDVPALSQFNSVKFFFFSKR